MAENTTVDHARRIVRIGERVYELRPRSYAAFDVYQGDEHVGAFAILENRRVQAEQIHQARVAGQQVQLVARLWVDSFAENEHPWQG